MRLGDATTANAACVCATRRIWLMRFHLTSPLVIPLFLPLSLPSPPVSLRVLSFASLIQLVTSDYYLRGRFPNSPQPPSLPTPLEDNSLCNCVSYGMCVRCVCVSVCVCLLNNFQLSASHVILQNNFQTAFAAAAAAKFTAQLWVSCVASHAPPQTHLLPHSGHWQQESSGY